MKLGENDIKLYLGSAEVDKVYLGTTQVYPSEEPTPVPYDEQYLTIESTSNNNTIYWRSGYVNEFKTISASTDNGSTWTAYTSSSGQTGTTIATLNSGDTIIFKGENAQYSSKGIFKSISSFIVYGNVMSLVYGDNFIGQTVLASHGTFGQLFSQCTGLTSAESLILPATTLANNCYQSMFYKCTSLTTAPELPATTLVHGCYNNMFQGCASLTTAPELPATTLAAICYQYMFQDCTNLNSITCLATDISASNCTSDWVYGVTTSGSFYVPSGNPASWKCGSDGVPSSWTIVDTNGHTYECTGGGEPSTDVPLENTFAVKYNGQWYESHDIVGYISEIEDYLGKWHIFQSDVEELAIGNETTVINLDGGSWGSCTGLTLAQNVTQTNEIHDFPAIQWVNVMAMNLEYMVVSGLFSDMNCCPIYVPENYLENYQMNWESETTDDCEGTVADRLVAWTPYIDPNA